MNGQDPGGWRPSGDPAQDYKELTRIFQGALAARRAGKDPQEYIDSQLGPGGPAMTMRRLSAAIASLAQQGGEPMTRGEKVAAGAEQAAIGMSLGLGKAGLPDAPTDESGQPLPLSQARTESQIPHADRLRMAGSFVPMAIGGAAMAPFGLGAQMGMQGLMSGTEQMATDPEHSLGRAAKAGGIGAGMTLVGSLMLHSAINSAKPAGTWVEQYMRRAGGETAVLARAAQQEAQTPGVQSTLAEAMGPDAQVMANRVVPRWNPNTRAVLIADAKRALAEAQAARAQVGAQYQALNKIIDSPALIKILQRPEVVELRESLRAIGEGPASELSASNVNDIRLMLQREANGYASKYARDPSPEALHYRTLYQKAANDLRAQLSREIPEFESLQREYGPYAQKVADRANALRQVMGQRVMGGAGGGARAMAVPLPKTLLSHLPDELKLHLGITDAANRFRTAADVAPILHKPVREALEMIPKLWPGFGRLTTETLGGSAAGAASPMLPGGQRSLLLPQQDQQQQPENPFFQNQ